MFELVPQNALNIRMEIDQEKINQGIDQQKKKEHCGNFLATWVFYDENRLWHFVPAGCMGR